MSLLATSRPVAPMPDPEPPASGASPGALVVRNLTVDFEGRRRVQAVRGVSFVVEPGTCVAIVGESGSGKSVTARALLGLAGTNSRVTVAELRAGASDLGAFTPAQWQDARGRVIGMVLQDALTSLDPLRTIGAEVAESPLVHGLWKSGEAPERVTALLHKVGVPNPESRRKQFPHQLSGGLRQRSLIAAALSAGPKFLIADEPTTALDVTIQAQVLDVLRSAVRDGMGLLLISHDLAVVSQIADTVLVMKEGVIVERGTPRQLLREPAHEYTRMLVQAVPAFASRGSRLSQGRPSGQSLAAIARDRVAPERGAEATVLRAEGVTKRFQVNGSETIDAVRGVDLELRRGEILGVVGESGSGKSTLGRMLLAYETPTSGTVTFHDQPWSVIPESRRRARRWEVQAISQDPLGSFDPRHTVQRVLSDALRAVKVPAAERQERQDALLAAVGLDPSIRDRHPRTLSGGQAQRVAIARALATGAQVLICDEAVSALDVSIQAQVLDLLLDLRAGMGLSVVFISHDLAVVHYLSDRVIVMHDGEIVEEGGAEAVFRNPQDAYTQRLISSLPALA